MKNFEFDIDMEMPTPCKCCGKIFDLNNGRGSEKWYPDTIICSECHDDEKEEIEEDERWETINSELCNALYGLNNEENRKSILQLVENSSINYIDPDEDQFNDHF